MTNEFNSHHNLGGDLERLKSKAQETLDSIAYNRCPHPLRGNYARYYEMTPDERLAMFHALHVNTMDLKNARINDPQALIGSFDAQVEVEDALASRGYYSVEPIKRDEMDRRIDLDKIDGFKDQYLFSRERVLLRCERIGSEEQKDENGKILRDRRGRAMYNEGPVTDYIIKRSHFIGDRDFVEQLKIDTGFLVLSDKKTLDCEYLLDHDNSLVIPHSVLYYIKKGMPDKIKPQYTDKDIQDILSMMNGKEPKHITDRAEETRPANESKDTLYIGGDLYDRDLTL